MLDHGNSHIKLEQCTVYISKVTGKLKFTDRHLHRQDETKMSLITSPWGGGVIIINF